jgi:hypothetical protein
MSSAATHADIADEVNRMKLGRLSTFTTKATLEMLRRRAYSPARFERLVAESPFRAGEIKADGMSLEIRLRK